MPQHAPVRRWETYWTDLEPAVGSEQGGERRPVLVISNDGFNRAFSVVTVLPLTKRAGKLRRIYPFEVWLPRGIAGNPVESIIMPYQIRTIDKKRLLAPMGVLRAAAVRLAVEDRLLEHLGIELNGWKVPQSA